VLDSEIVAHDAQGRVDFEGLQSRWMLSHPREISAAENKSPTAMYASTPFTRTVMIYPNVA